MGHKKVTIYQKIKVLTLLQAGLTYSNIRNKQNQIYHWKIIVVNVGRNWLPSKTIADNLVDNERLNGAYQMERLLVAEQFVDAYLLLVTRAIQLNENHIENIIIPSTERRVLWKKIVCLLVVGSKVKKTKFRKILFHIHNQVHSNRRVSECGI